MRMDEKIRVFICINFSDEIVKEVARVQEVLGTRKFTGKLTELENLHLTLKFLGGVDSGKLDEVKKRLGKIKVEEFEARLGGAGIFNYGKKPRIVWIKVLGEGVMELQGEVDRAFEGLFEKEERFMSHLTVARVKYVADKKGFVNYVRGISVKKLRWKVGGFKLMSSELERMGPRYETIKTFGLS